MRDKAENALALVDPSLSHPVHIASACAHCTRLVSMSGASEQLGLWTDLALTEPEASID